MRELTPDIVIISGLSGSGKSVALPRHIETKHGVAFPGAAVGIDSRNQHFLQQLDTKLAELEDRGEKYRILFLEAEEQKLIRRYSETRRKHPLTDDYTPLIEGIRLERQLLQPMQERAEKIIDTTETTPHELRGLVRDFAGWIKRLYDFWSPRPRCYK